MFKAFSDLNHRFQSLIHHPSILIRLEYDSRKSIPVEDYCQEIIQPNKDRLRSLHIVDGWNIERRFDHFIFDESFLHLESLKMHDISADQLTKICFSLKSLPRLYSFSVVGIQVEHEHDMSEIICLILSFPVLKRCTIITEIDPDVPNIVLPTAINLKPSSMEYLCIGDSASLPNLVSLLEHLSNIRYLDCGFFAGFNENPSESKQVNLPHLKQLSFRNSSLRFDQVEALIKIIGHHVEVFKFCHYVGRDYLVGGRWENMIEKYLPRLKIFIMDCEEIELEPNESIDNLIGPFYSKFWTERQWFPTVCYGVRSMRFGIHPYQ